MDLVVAVTGTNSLELSDEEMSSSEFFDDIQLTDTDAELEPLFEEDIRSADIKRDTTFAARRPRELQPATRETELNKAIFRRSSRYNVDRHPPPAPATPHGSRETSRSSGWSWSCAPTRHRQPPTSHTAHTIHSMNRSARTSQRPASTAHRSRRP